MLQDIRSNIQGTIAKIIIGLIVVSFSIFGIESILLGGGGNAVAEVNGEEITPMELQTLVTNQRRQILSMLGDQADPSMLDEQRLSAAALQNLIERRLLLQSAKDMNLAVADQQVGALIGSMEQFQIDGQFSPEMYRSVLSGAGYTPQMFKRSLSEDLLISQLRGGIAASEFSTPVELAVAAEILEEQRDVRYLSLPVADFRVSSEPDDAAIQAFYEANQDRFMTAETVELNYIELTVDDFREPVPEARLREEFELTRSDYQYQTENRVSHILLIPGSDESDEAFSERLAAVQSALDGGMSFEDAAREFSDDIGSADAGGDLGFSAGDAFPEAMEEAIADLPVDAISAPVETEAGTHIIKVTERREGESVSFEEVRPELEETIQLAEARSALIATAEDLRDLVFNAEDLTGPAEALGLDVQRSGPVSRDQQEGLFGEPRLVAAAFSEDVLDLGHNSEVVELDPDHFVTLRVRQHNMPEVQPLSEVREQIAAQLTEEAARQAAQDLASEIIDRLAAGEALDAIAAERELDWQVELGATRRSTTLPAAVREAAFELAVPEGGDEAYTQVTDGQGLLYVIELDRVTPGQVDQLAEARRTAIASQLAGESGALLQRQFESALRARADITVYQ
jgi:peptidyl-prolyl cis-trans isomerase D